MTPVVSVGWTALVVIPLIPLLGIIPAILWVLS